MTGPIDCCCCICGTPIDDCRRLICTDTACVDEHAIEVDARRRSKHRVWQAKSCLRRPWKYKREQLTWAERVLDAAGIPRPEPVAQDDDTTDRGARR